jgi:YjbR
MPSMNASDFRRIALGMPEATEQAHMAHPDFRVRGKIFATLGYPDAAWGMVKLTPEQQRSYVQLDPAGFVPVKGAWGAKGCTNIRLSAAREELLQEAMRAASGNVPGANGPHLRKRR